MKKPPSPPKQRHPQHPTSTPGPAKAEPASPHLPQKPAFGSRVRVRARGAAAEPRGPAASPAGPPGADPPPPPSCPARSGRPAALDIGGSARFCFFFFLSFSPGLGIPRNRRRLSGWFPLNPPKTGGTNSKRDQPSVFRSSHAKEEGSNLHKIPGDSRLPQNGGVSFGFFRSPPKGVHSLPDRPTSELPEWSKPRCKVLDFRESAVAQRFHTIFVSSTLPKTCFLSHTSHLPRLSPQILGNFRLSGAWGGSEPEAQGPPVGQQRDEDVAS